MVQFRAGSVEDTDAVLALFDANIVWLVERGRSDQWGSDPFSENPALVGFARDMLASGVVTIAEIDGDVVGASVVTDHPMPYVPAIDEPERYLKLLIASPAHRGEKIGHRLIELARELHDLRRCRTPASRLLGRRRSQARVVLRKRRLHANAGDRGSPRHVGAGLRMAPRNL